MYYTIYIPKGTTVMSDNGVKTRLLGIVVTVGVRTGEQFKYQLVNGHTYTVPVADCAWHESTPAEIDFFDPLVFSTVH